MRKILVSLVGLLLLVGASVADSAVFNFVVRDEQNRPIATGYTVQVYTIASTGAPDTIYPDTDYSKSMTNPMNPSANGSFKFATSASTVDIVVWGYQGRAMGATARVDDMTDQDHIIVLNTQQVNKHLRFFWDANISQGAEINTGILLPVGTIIDDIFVEVATALVNASVSVGLLSTQASGDADGFCRSQGVDFAAVPSQIFRCEASATTGVTGAGQRYTYSSSTRGVLLGLTTPGNLALTVNGTDIASIGQNMEKSHIIKQGAANVVTYMTNDKSHDAGPAGWVHLFYRELKARKTFN